MEEKKWFRVKYGYGVNDFISVTEDYLAKAIYAKQKQSLFSYGDKIIDGKEIKNIVPDYHKYTGWNAWYEPTSTEDFIQIERDCPSFSGYVDKATTIAIDAVRNNNPKLLLTPLSSNNLLHG